MDIRNVGMVSAWLLASLIGCGSVKTNPATDAADPTTDATNTANDGGVDAAGPDAQTNGTITVKVMIAGNPAEGIPVFSHDIDGSYIASALTNSSGEVTIDDFPAGGAVTAPVGPFINGGDIFRSDNQLTSVTGVQIGDTLTLGNSKTFLGEPLGPFVGSAVINPPAAPVTNATRYNVYIQCHRRFSSTPGGSLSLTLREECIKADNTIDAIAIAADSTGTRLAYATRTGIPVTGVAPNKAASASLNGWNTDFASLRVNLQNVPFDGFNVISDFRGYRDNLLLDDTSLSNPGDLDIGDQAFMARKAVPNFNNDAAYTVAVEATEATSFVSTREQLSFNPGTNLVRNVDLTSDLLSVIENIAVTGVGDLAVTWTTAGSAVGCKGSPVPDNIVTVVRGETGNDNDHIWFVLSQGSTSQSVTFPKLDPALAQTIWPISTFTNVRGGVAVFSDTARTWDEIRREENNLTYFDYVPLPDSSRCVSTGGALNLD